MHKRFDAFSASQGAASIGLITSFAFMGSIVLAKPSDLPLAIGAALLLLAAIYFVALLVTGRVARKGGYLEEYFDFRAGGHGASGFCIVGIFACSGILTLNGLWQHQAALGVALLVISAGCAIGLISFGLMGRSSGGDQESSRPVAGNEDTADEEK